MFWLAGERDALLSAGSAAGAGFRHACSLVIFLVLFSPQQTLLARTSDLLEQQIGNRNVEARLDAAIERLTARENVERFKIMLQSPRDEAHRQVLSTLLVEEEAKLQSAIRS